MVLIIILEGPDGSGKTTLKDELVRDVPALSLVERHCTSDGPKEGLSDWVEKELWGITAGNKNLLYDRHGLISEPIYGPLVRGNLDENFSNDEWYLKNWGRFLYLRPTIIFCLPPLDTVIENVSKSHQMKGVEAVTTAIWHSYRNLYLQMRIPGGLPIVKYDYTHPDSKVHYRLLVNLLKARLKVR